MIDKIKQIKYSRLSEEERFFLETIDGIKQFKLEKFPQSIYWIKDNNILFSEDYEYGDLRVNYNIIWKHFLLQYGYDNIRIQSFIKKITEKYSIFGSTKQTLTPITSEYSDFVVLRHDSYLYFKPIDDIKTFK